MSYLITGVLLLATLLGLFWLKDELRSPRLARLAYSEFTARLAIIAAGLMLVGVVVIAGQVLHWLGAR